MTPETNSNTFGNQVVVGYFARNEDARRAIDDLLTEGFEARQIGAAFRSRDAVSTGNVDTTQTSQEAGPVENKTVQSSIDSNTVGSGAASDTRAVTPAGLATGSGSLQMGAGKKGPIPGAEIPHRNSELPSELPSTGSAAKSALPATGGFHESRATHEEGWWNKLKHLFSSESDATRGPNDVVNNDSTMKFGTGEGHLATYPQNEYEYSGSAFESAFSGMGVKSSHAHSLAGDLHTGGAVITVAAAPETLADAERIFAQNNGRVRYEEGYASTTAWTENPDERVHVFGAVSRAYPGYSTSRDVRKAS